MSKRIKQNFSDNGTVRTYTTGNPRGGIENFDVSITSQPRHYKQATEFSMRFGNGSIIECDGRHARTLYEVLDRHFSEVD